MKSLLFSLGSGAHRTLCLPSKNFCFPQSRGISVIKPCWHSKSDSLGSPPIARPQAWKPDVGLRTFTPENFYGIIIFQFVRYAGMRFDFIMITPFLPFCCGFFFVLRCQVFFWKVPTFLLLLMVVMILVFLYRV